MYVFLNILSIACSEHHDLFSKNDLFFKVYYSDKERKSKIYYNKNKVDFKDNEYVFLYENDNDILKIELYDHNLTSNKLLSTINININDSLTHFEKWGIKGLCGLVNLQSVEESEFQKNLLLELTDKINNLEREKEKINKLNTLVKQTLIKQYNSMLDILNPSL